MMDEQLLMERLTDAAAAQDDLLPRAVADDLAAGRRRLRRRRCLAGGTALIAAGAVAVATIGMSGALRDTAQLEVPIATQKPPTAAVTKAQSFDGLMKSLMYRHFDPTKKHLNFTTGPFEIDNDLGHHGTQRKVGWNSAGDQGQGMFLIELNRSGKGLGTKCGSYFEFESRPVSCQEVTLPNGRTAMLGRRGRMIEFSYVQPDGEYLNVAVDPVFRNNTTIASKDMAVTDAQLFAFATDPELNLPPLTTDQQNLENTLEGFAPANDQIRRIAGRHLPGQLLFGRVDQQPGELLVLATWMRGPVRAEVEIGLDVAPLASDCPSQLSVPSCVPVTLPNGAKGEYHEGARTYQGGPRYVMGATYQQPDGDLVSVRVLYDGTKRTAGAITKEQILALVSDPGLDR
ncbi:hypothetical protein GCM10009745_01490 [Kribbella yunnanensis]|uniref:DUF4179 domain-containing protein n=1 Tax=Kribbella yunnanensis TaxID=190194 RepID=A0ABN2G1B1_9ACTN